MTRVHRQLFTVEYEDERGTHSLDLSGDGGFSVFTSGQAADEAAQESFDPMPAYRIVRFIRVSHEPRPAPPQPEEEPESEPYFLP